MSKPSTPRERRRQLEGEIIRLSRIAIFGSLSETYRFCGSQGCRCHSGGPKHGPYLTISYRSGGKTTGYSVPRDAETTVREGVAAWQSLHECLRELAEQNKTQALDDARTKREAST
jgi:hypothetical protein